MNGCRNFQLIEIKSAQTVYSEDLVSIPGDKQLYIPVGFYKGCKLAIKKIHESDISLNRDQMLELKKVGKVHAIV